MVKMLQIGMLWFDDSPQRSLVAKITLAAQHYHEKYGDVPNVCYVHPSCLGNIAVEGQNTEHEPSCMHYKGDHPIQVLAARDILPNHLWLGVSERGEKPLN
jgi:hypothetical protein